MKSLVAILAAAVALAGCGTEKEFILATNAQKEQTQMVLNYHKEVNLRRLDNAMAVEKQAAIALAEKHKADAARFNALKELGAKADAGGKVAIARSLEEKAEVAAKPSLLNEPVAAITIPTVPMPKSAAQEAKEWVGLAVQGLGILTNGYLGAKQISGNVAMNRQNNEAATAQHGATMATMTAQSTNQTTLGVAAVNAQAALTAPAFASMHDIVAELTKNPTVVNNVTIKCPQSLTASTGTGGSSAANSVGGNSGASGTGGTSTGSGPAGATGLTGSAGQASATANAGASGGVVQNANLECVGVKN